MDNIFQYLKPNEAVYTGKVAETIKFITEKQLKDRELWRMFVEQFRTHADTNDLGWRGEYWGKMMRGGCLTYIYSGDESLYAVLKEAVEGLIETQDELGRISTYDTAVEFNGWDMWCRKYVLTGLQHFYRICKEDELKVSVKHALMESADYICSKIGEGKIDIRTTSSFWGGVNSCSILEPFVELYKLTKEQRYLDFARYIIDGGGCIDGNLLQCAATEGCYPYQYPEVKVYETMSFFEGVLAYYEVTGEKQYLDVVMKFVEDAYKTDGTIVGGVGGGYELFDNFHGKQTEEIEADIQETCVTVTWIRLLVRLFLLTGKANYADRIERSSFNALWGSLNTEWNKCYRTYTQEWFGALPFDSYSPLVNGRRAREIGGFRMMANGVPYGCCACIGAAGFALVPLFGVLRNENGFVFNFYFNGEINTKTPMGNDVKIKITSLYPCDGKVKVDIDCKEKEEFCIQFRKPTWGKEISVKGISYTESADYIVVEKEWCGQESIELQITMELSAHELNGKTAFSYGPLILALEEGKGNGELNREFVVDSLTGKMEILKEKELLRFEMNEKDGKLLFMDYASSGKEWEREDSKISVWLKVRK